MNGGEGGTPTDRSDERSLGELFASASEDFQALVRDEIALAKAEMKGTVKGVSVGGGGIGGAGVLVIASVPVLSIAAGYGIHAWWDWPLGWSFAFVGGLFWVVAAVLVLVAAKSFKKAKAPRRAMEQNKKTMAVLGRAKPRPAVDPGPLDAAARAIEDRNSRPALDAHSS